MQFCHPIRSGIAVSRTVTGRYWIKKERKKQTNKETNKQTNKQTKKQTNKDRNKKARNKQTNKAKKRGKERKKKKKTVTKKETKRNKQRNKEGRKERKKQTNKESNSLIHFPLLCLLEVAMHRNKYFRRDGHTFAAVTLLLQSHFCCGHTFAAVTLLLRSHFCCGRQLLLVTANSDFIQQGWPSHSNLNNEPFTWPLIQFYLEKCQFFPFCPGSCVCDPPCKPLHPWQAQFSWGDLNYLGTTLGFIYISEHLTT